MQARKQRRRNADILCLQKKGMLVEIAENDDLVCVLQCPGDLLYTGRWRINIHLTDEYPFKSPSVAFIDKIYHPNVEFSSGAVCLNALNQEWTPIYQLTSIIDTLLPQLLAYPNPDDPLNNDAAECLLNNYDEYVTRVHRFQGDST